MANAESENHCAGRGRLKQRLFTPLPLHSIKHTGDVFAVACFDDKVKSPDKGLGNHEQGDIPVNSAEASDAISSAQHSHWGFWGTLIWSVLILAIFFALQIVTVIVLVMINSGPPSETELSQKIVSMAYNGNVLSVTIVLTSLVCLGLLVGAAKLKNGSVLKEYFAIKAVPFKTMVNWIGALAVILVLADLITRSLGRPIVPEFMSTAYATASPVLPFWFALVVAAPVFEEAFFRGFLLKGLESSFVGPIGAVVATAGLWAAIHLQYDAPEIAIIFSVGLLLGTARIFTGSLLVPIGLHAITNLAATIQAALHL